MGYVQWAAHLTNFLLAYSSKMNWFTSMDFRRIYLESDDYTQFWKDFYGKFFVRLFSTSFESD